MTMVKRNNHQDELGPDSAGQSGDLQGISDVANADSESLRELLEQGNAFEAEAVDGVENAKDPDVSEVTTREVPEDDVPEEYRNAS
jgi:N utilization substance protein A